MKRLAILLFLATSAVPALADEDYVLAIHPNRGSVTFRLRGFTTSEAGIVKEALRFLRDRIREHLVGHERGDSPLERCTAHFATKDWFRWNDLTVSALQRKKNNAYWTYTSFTMGVQKHIDDRRPVYIDAFSENSNTTGRAQIGWMPTSPSNTPTMDIQLNRSNLAAFGAEAYAGTIYHEFMHRFGLNHPNGYEGSLIKEAGLCITYKYQTARFGLTSGMSAYDIID